MERAPEPGCLFTDRVGPWFDADGSEIVLPCGEAFDAAVEDVIGSWTVRSNIGALDGRTISIGHPALTLLAQHEWERVSNLASPPRHAFLLQLDGPQPTTGRVCEQLIVGVLFDQLAHEAWPDAQLVDTWDAVDGGLLVQPRAGSRTDDLTLVGPAGPIALIEVKATIKGWPAVRRPVRTRALRQLQSTSAMNSGARLDLVVVGAALQDRLVGVFRLPDDPSAAETVNGHRNRPADGQQNCPAMANGTAQRRSVTRPELSGPAASPPCREWPG